MTDRRVYRALGDILCGELDCIPANVTKNPVAVGFGNTHNAPQAYRNDNPDTHWIAEKIEIATANVLSTTKKRNRERKKKAKRKKHYETKGRGTGGGENISAFIEQCNAVSEMVKAGLLTPGRGNEYRWHEASSDHSCELMGDGVLHIFSHSMSAASPAAELEPVNAHRFYLYQLTGLDLKKDSDKPKCREYLFGRGYGSDPKLYHARRSSTTKLSHSQKKTRKKDENTALTDNSAERAESTDRFLNRESELLQIQFVKDDTGSGKTHTALTSAAALKKKALALTETVDLAYQLTATALEVGFTDPCTLKGRSYGFTDETSDIPVDERTKDLFESMECPEFDQLPELDKARIPHRHHCETRCNFKEPCREVGYLSQFVGLEHRDFIATANPNIFFDPHLHGYLHGLVTARDEPTDIEMAIDAMLGTETETKPLEYGIIDDYTVNSFFTDIHFSEKEFKTLKKVWEGTPTAVFASQVLKAFKKTKPHKILKALRSAYKSTEADHEILCKSLTQHARIGTVEYAERAVASKETQHVLAEKIVRYTDGGTQFIPVSMKAFAELKDKGIPVIHPTKVEPSTSIGEKVLVPHAYTTALAAGVKLSDLTPRWNTGTTPVELLKMLLDFVENDKNAHISKRYTVGNDTRKTNAIIEFSIPLQAPKGIIKHLTLLSATTDPEDVKQALSGQPVAYSEYHGKPLPFADGVQVYQFTDARLTSASVFEYPTEKDKRQLQEPPIDLTETAKRRIAKVNQWAKETDGFTAFISYKEFTDAPFREAVNNFDIVTHFDKMNGLNLDGLKFLVVFGYPKVKHEVVMEQARKQYAKDSVPLPKGDKHLKDDNGKTISEYIQLTGEIHACDINTGVEFAERRYLDARLDKIRHQLATDKLRQAIGRARLVRWENTTTQIITSSPVPNITERAILFSDAALTSAEKPNELGAAQAKIEKAITTGDVKALAEATGESERTAYRQTAEKRKQTKSERNAEIKRRYAGGDAETQEEIAIALGINKTTVSRVLKS